MSNFENYFMSTLKYRYADFSGRARRSEFWYFVLFYTLIVLMFYAIIGMGYAMESSALMMIGSGLVGIFLLGVLIPYLAVTVRRLHDTGKSGWMILIGLIPIVGSIALIVFYCTDSQSRTNKWGKNPKEIGNDEVADHLIS